MIDTLYGLFVQPLTQQAFQKALIGGSLAAVACGVIGCYIILRRMAFLGDALSHAMLAGVTAGYLIMQSLFGNANVPSDRTHATAMLMGSVLAGLVTVLLIGFVSKVSRIKDDTAIGIIYTGLFALGGILASLYSDRIHIDLFHFVNGMVLGVEDADLWVMAIVTTVVLVIVVLFFRQLKITSFDPVMAASLGISVLGFNYLLTTCASLVVISAVSLVGVIMVIGLLVTPAATAYLLCDRLYRMQILAACFGVLGVVGGLYISTWIGNIATAPSIVVFSTLQFLVVLVAAPRYGMIADWLRRRRTVPQQLVEDVLGCFRNTNQRTIPLTTVQRHVDASADQLRRALVSLERQDLLTMKGSALTLTEAGQRESRRLLRAHRLWESYLQHVGTPEDQLHERAHKLEHLHDEATVDYLDDKLGHPLHDPHGAEIPEDLIDLVPGTLVRVSLLREGHRGTIEELPPSGPMAQQLQTGMRVTAGPRRDNEKTWTLQLPNGDELQLDHVTADTVRVRLDNAQSQ